MKTELWVEFFYLIMIAWNKAVKNEPIEKIEPLR